jgi:hypothetical protein
MSIYIWCTIFFIIGIVIGLQIAVTIMTYAVKHGTLFFKGSDGMWMGEWDIITKELNALILKENAKK